MGESWWNEPRVNTGNKINETLDGLVFTIDRSYEKIIDRIAARIDEHRMETSHVLDCKCIILGRKPPFSELKRAK